MKRIPAAAMSLLFHLLLFLSTISWTDALKHNYAEKNMHRSLVGPLGFPFGFTETGFFNLTVFDFSLEIGGHDDMDEDRRHLNLDEVEGVGFLLKRFKDEAEFNHYLNELAAEERCAFQPFLDEANIDEIFEADDDYEEGSGIVVDSPAQSGIFLDMTPRPGQKPKATAVAFYQFKKGDEGLYFLLYQICPPPKTKDMHSSFKLDFHFSNLDLMGNESYLSAGEMPLPHMFFYFSLVYAVCLFLWISNIRLISAGESGRWRDNEGGALQATVYPIHHLMTILLTLKFLSLFFESIRYHFLRATGHAKFWSGLYYTFAFMKGTFLFTVILLLGSGWSFVKPFLGDREKAMAFAVLGLQVINNIAIVVLTQKTEGERAFDRWTAVLHMVDILCCCAVLIPIVWQVNALEKNMEQSDNHNDDEIIDMQEDITVPEDEFEEAPPTIADARLASKLKLFRSFYLLVVGYIYFTRIVVYLFATMLDYRRTWLRHFVVEAVTLAFYVTVGYQFRPMSENPYLTVQQDDSKLNGQEVEMSSKSA